MQRGGATQHTEVQHTGCLPACLPAWHTHVRMCARASGAQALHASVLCWGASGRRAPGYGLRAAWPCPRARGCGSSSSSSSSSSNPQAITSRTCPAAAEPRVVAEGVGGGGEGVASLPAREPHVRRGVRAGEAGTGGEEDGRGEGRLPLRRRLRLWVSDRAVMLWPTVACAGYCKPCSRSCARAAHACAESVCVCGRARVCVCVCVCVCVTHAAQFSRRGRPAPIIRDVGLTKARGQSTALLAHMGPARRTQRGGAGWGRLHGRGTRLSTR